MDCTKLNKLKSGFKQYIETRQSPALVFIGFMCLIVIAFSPSEIVEKSLSKTGFRVVYILLLCIIILVGNLDRNTENKQEFNPEA